LIVLTPEEHEEWIHLCGKPGREIYPGDCRDCDLGSYCVAEHAIQGQDFFLVRP